MNRSLVSELLVSAFLTILVWFEFWGGRVPLGINATILLIGFIGGISLTIVGLAVRQRSEVKKLTANDFPFVVIMMGLVLIGLILFPSGLPVTVEIGLIVFIWAWPLGKVIERYRQAPRRE
jgi:hypothetical protein